MRKIILFLAAVSFSMASFAEEAKAVNTTQNVAAAMPEKPTPATKVVDEKAGESNTEKKEVFDAAEPNEYEITFD